MLDDGGHAVWVDAWLDRSASGLPPEALLRLFEAALDAVWVRTKTTLGEVTLTAIAARVLHNASERFSLLWSIKVEPKVGIQCHELSERLGSLQPTELREAIRFVLVELLSVLGNLTAEILTPAIRAELANVRLSDAISVARKPALQSTDLVQAEGREKQSWQK
jgi:hypothetical protein